jgi:hypothetical protein
LSTYTLDFDTIQQVMRAHRKTGILYAEIASGVMKLREPCRIEIKIITGDIATCTIVGSSGRYLTGAEATQELARLGRIRWTFTPQQPAATLVAPVMPSERDTSPYPRRTAYLDQEQMRNWPRLHRSVFALADGTKSIIKIAEVLVVPPEIVNKVLQDLQSIGVITMGPRN